MSEPAKSVKVATSPEEPTLPADESSPRAERFGAATIAGFAIGAAALGLVAITTDGFLTLANFRAILRSAAITGIVAVAMTPVMLSGNFVSLATQQSAMAGMVSFIAMVGAGWSPWLAVVVILVGLSILGVFQALLIVGGLNPIITTLAAGAIVFGAVNIGTGGAIVRLGDNDVVWGDASVVGVPIEILVFVVFTAIVTLAMSRTVVGRETYLVGSNEETARVSAISVVRVTVWAFLIFSAGLAIAAALSGAAFGEATIQSFGGLTIDSIAAMLVGGSAITGGRGSPLNSAFGAILIAITVNVMLLHALSTGLRLTLQGAVVVGVVLVLHILRSRGERS